MSDLNVTAKQAFAKIQKHEADMATRAKKEGVEIKDAPGVIEKDSLKVAPGLEKKSSDELNKLYETYNKDGADGLTETEFDSLFTSVMTEGTKETPASGESKSVTVKAGDTLSKIARENGVSLAQLKEANPDLFKDGKDAGGKTRSAGGNLIYPGDKVTIPQKPSTTETGATSEKDKTEKKDKAEETKKPEETGKTEKTDKPKETDKTKETEKTGKETAQQEIKKAKETIDNAKIEDLTPEALENMTVKDLKDLLKKDTATMEGVKDAIKKIPTTDPQWGEYDGKAKKLEADFNAAYPTSDTPEKSESLASTPAVQEKLDQAAGAGSRGNVQAQQEALRAAVKEAKQPEDFAAIADAAKAAGQRDLATAIRAAADPKVGEEVRKEIRNALQDGKNTDDDLGDALKNAQSPEDFEAIAAAAKVAENSRYPQLATAITALANPNLSPSVRTELRKALDDTRNTGNEVLRAIEKAGNRYDQAAIAAVAGTLKGDDLAHVRQRVDINQLSPGVARALEMKDLADAIQATQDMEGKLAEKAGHAVDIRWDTDRRLDPAAMMKQLEVLRGALDDSSFETMWGRYDRIEFNTFESARDSGDVNNLRHYAQVDGQTLKLNNAGDDGLTAVEQDKQRRALEHVRNTGRGT